MTLSEGLRAALVVVWLASPPFLAFLAVLRGRRVQTDWLAKTRIAIPIAVATVTNWVLFVVLLVKAQTPYGVIFRTSALMHTLLLFSFTAAVISLAVSNARWPLFSANSLLITLWIVIAYAPSHWLREWDYGKVSIDGHPTRASFFIAHPWDSEADAVVLVHVPAAADYFLSFGEEKFRLAGTHDYVRIPGGVWCLPSLRDMIFAQPLASHQLNEFRIASPQGRVVSVQF